MIITFNSGVANICHIFAMRTANSLDVSFLTPKKRVRNSKRGGKALEPWCRPANMWDKN